MFSNKETTILRPQECVPDSMLISAGNQVQCQSCRSRGAQGLAGVQEEQCLQRTCAYSYKWQYVACRLLLTYTYEYALSEYAAAPKPGP